MPWRCVERPQTPPLDRRSREFRIGSCGALLLGFSWKRFLALLVLPGPFIHHYTGSNYTSLCNEGRALGWVCRMVGSEAGRNGFAITSVLHLRLPQVLETGIEGYI
jgi:hypothetical protein